LQIKCCRVLLWQTNGIQCGNKFMSTGLNFYLSVCYSILMFFNLSLILRVSSVLNRDCNHYGKKYMFDKNEDTCWNSDQVSAFIGFIGHPKERFLK